jgi:zinc/manganese transport system substrate-binding protein
MIKPRTTAALAAIAASFAIMVATKARALDAVASFTILADMVHQVGGGGVRVTSLVGPNADPHAFVPTPQDARRIRAADIVFVNGLGLEGWMDRLIAASGYEGDVIVTSEGTQKRDAEENGKQILDPHAWNSAANGVVYVQNIVRALSVADPTNAAT